MPEDIEKTEMWQEYEKVLAELDAFRREYSNKAATLLGDIKTSIMDANDAYFSQRQTTYEWTSLVQTVLKTYLKVKKSEGHKKALIKIFGDGVTKLDTALATYATTSSTFDSFLSRATSMITGLESEFDAKSKAFETKLQEMRAAAKSGSGSKKGEPKIKFEKDLVPQLLAKMEGMKKFQTDLKMKLNDATRDIDNTKAKLREESDMVGNLKTKIEPVKTFLETQPEANDDFEKSAQDLVAACDKYRERHNN